MKKHVIKSAAVLLAALIAALVMTMPVSAADGRWVKDDTGWWYSYSDGGYAKNCWKKINGTWYAFDRHGYMRTGWFEENGKWYFLDVQSGAMLTGWQQPEKWRADQYYFDGSGAMYLSWLYQDGKWYYLDKDAYRSGTLAWKREVIWNGDSYCVDENGVLIQNKTFAFDNYLYAADQSGKITKRQIFSDIALKLPDPHDPPEYWEFIKDESELLNGTRSFDGARYSVYYRNRRYIKVQGKYGVTGPRISIKVRPLTEQEKALSDSKYRSVIQDTYNQWKEEKYFTLGNTTREKTMKQENIIIRRDLDRSALQLKAVAEGDITYNAIIMRRNDVEIKLVTQYEPAEQEWMEKALEQIAGTIEIIR